MVSAVRAPMACLLMWARFFKARGKHQEGDASIVSLRFYLDNGFLSFQLLILVNFS
jgi:hypothetical protein